jgi:hypothetical protein
MVNYRTKNIIKEKKVDQITVLIAIRKAMRMLSTTRLVDADCPYVCVALIDTGSTRALLQVGQFVFQGDSPYSSAPIHAIKKAEETIQELRYVSPTSKKANVAYGRIFLTSDTSGDRIAIAVGGVRADFAQEIVSHLAEQLAHDKQIILR